jgi:hypothetical protein
MITLLAATTFKDFYKTSVKLGKALWTVLKAMQAQNLCKNKSKKNLTSKKLSKSVCTKSANSTKN